MSSSISSSSSSTWFVARGDKGERVKDLQRDLKKLGYDIGSAGVDGSFGPSTEKALKAFQKDRKIEVDGSYGPHSQKEMKAALGTLPENFGDGQWFAVKGDKGPKVEDMQSKLIKLGYDLGSSGADGSFGPATEKAVKAFQKDRKIAVDGSYGPKTQEEVAEALEELKEKQYKNDELSQEEKNKADTGFKDVPSDAYYAAAVRRMAARDIMLGLGNANFGVGKVMNREYAACVADRILRDVDAQFEELEAQIEELKEELRKALDK